MEEEGGKHLTRFFKREAFCGFPGLEKIILGHV
jgi:hypothetical protein